VKRNYLHLLLVIILQLSFVSFSWSQDKKEYSHNSLAEKIYLQLDNEVYTTNKTIWFKAIILNATAHNTEYSSGILYVDFINSNSRIMESKLIKIKDGVGHGHFDLDRSIEDGVYLIRAYTEWNKNFDPDFMFEKYIQIFSESSEDTISSVIENIRIVDSNTDSYTVVADVFPKVIDSEHEEELSVTITSDGLQETIYLEANQDANYVLEYEVPKTSKRMALEIETSNASKHTTTFSPNKDYLDLQFFPESGKFLNGLSSKIGFKALGVDSKGVEVEGQIVNQDNQVVASFKSNRLGMGSFDITDPKLDDTYKAKVVYRSNTLKTEVALPKVHAKGYAMSVKEKDDTIYVVALSANDDISKITLKAECRGYTYLNEEASLIDGRYIYVIPKKNLPDGIIAFTLFKESKLPAANRLYFNTRHDGRIHINANLDKSDYQKRDEIKLMVSTKNVDSLAIIAHTSILAVRSQDYVTEQLSKDNILSYFLMSSDLKGAIEEPHYYFSSGKEKELDHLMLTQGWINFKYHEPLKKLSYKLEKQLSVTGVINKKSRAKKNEMNLFLMTFDSARTTYAKKVKVPSSFSFDLEDLYGNQQDIIIQGAEDWDKIHKNYAIAVQKKKPSPITFDYDNTNKLDDSLLQIIVKTNRAQKEQEDLAYFNTFGSTALEEVVISGYNMTPKRKEVYEKYGEPEIVIDGRDLLEKEENNHSSGLYSILLGFHQDKIQINQDPTGLLSAKVYGEFTMVIIDGIPVQKIFYPQLQNIVISQVTSFEVLRTSKNYAKLFSILYPGAFPVPNFGGLISIYTKKGIGLFGALDYPDKSLNLETIPVFAVEKEFYAPQHDSDSDYDPNAPDLRGPIYWNPNSITDDNGEVKINYYHSDDVGDFKLIIESVSDTGKIGYKVLNYSVEKTAN